MLPAAPGRFSTTTDCPSACERGWATDRADTSTPPPAWKPTIIRIGLYGYGCASSATGDTTPPINTARQINESVLLMQLLFNPSSFAFRLPPSALNGHCPLIPPC